MMRRNKGHLRQLAVSLLAVFTLISAFPPAAAAERPQAATEAPTVYTGDYRVDGTNSVGRLLTSALEEGPGGEEGEYGVSSLTVEAGVVTADFHAAGKALLVAAVYDEETGGMLASGRAQVAAADTSVTFDLDVQTLPSYFTAKAFLLDGELQPLCPAYTCLDYTSAYAESMRMTVDDFPAERVINLDGDTSDNFMVLKEGAVTVEGDGETNRLLAADEQQGVYTFENIDGSLAALKPGDIFHYDGQAPGCDLIVIKVATVESAGGKAVITAADAGIPDVFDYVKVDTSGQTQDFALVEGSAGPGVTYLGDAPYTAAGASLPSPAALSPAAAQNARLGGTADIGVAKKFGLEYSTGSGSDKFTLSGSLELGLKGHFTVLYDFRFMEDDYFEAGLVIDASARLSAKAEGKAAAELKLAEFGFAPLPGVYVGIRPKLVAEAKASVELSAELAFTVGGSFDSENGFVNECKSPGLTTQLELEGNFFFGLDLQPYLHIVSEKLAEVSITGRMGAHVDAVMTYTDQDPRIRHDCQHCLDGSIYGEASIRATATLGQDTWVEHEWSVQLFKITTAKAKFYFSVDHLQWGWGNCPYKEVEILFQVVDGQGTPLPGIQIDGVATDEKGECRSFQPAGVHTLVLGTPGYRVVQPADNTYTAEEPATIRIVLEERRPGEDVLASGSGGDGVLWILYADGEIVVSGSGELEGFGDQKEIVEQWAAKATVEAGVTAIGRNAFSGCTALETAILPDGLTELNTSAFSGCVALSNITLPDSLRRLGNGAFQDCAALTQMDIPDGVEELGERLFQGCVGLRSVRMPAGIQSVKYRMFYGCANLLEVAIPDSVTSIGQGAFQDCTALASLRLPAAVDWIDEAAFKGCESLTDFAIPVGVTHLGEEAFGGCASLAYLAIPDGVTEIGYAAFSGCTSLREVVIPDSVQKIGSSLPVRCHVFSGCESLASISIPQGVTQIGNSMFSGCTALQTVELPDSVTYIGENAFRGCESLGNIRLPENLTELEAHAFQDCAALTELAVPAGLVRIREYTFAASGLKAIELPADLTQIDRNAFSDCTALQTVDLPDSLTDIGMYAFQDCTALSSLRIPGGVANFGSQAFAGCTGLKTLEVEQGVTDLGVWAFQDCTGLISVSLPGSLTRINGGVFEGCSSLPSVVIPEGVESIEAFAFSYCDNLTAVYIPSTLTEISSYAFIMSPVTLYGVSTAGVHIAALPAGQGESAYTPGPSGAAAALFVPAAAAEEKDGEIPASGSYTASPVTTGCFYLFICVRDPEAQDLLAPENLLYIDQKTATEDSLAFSYANREDAAGFPLLIAGENPAGDLLLGDMSGDGRINIEDVMALCKILARKSAGEEPGAEEVARGDIDGDMALTIADVMGICKIIARGA